ncbi:glycine--tRNA ligase [Candidatus Saccharibacteria bacterium]|nr:glycine--tRNA ligase [Candidatus Saccharibacteria bacterium]
MSVALEDIVSLCKRRGFIYQGSEIYGGLAGTWDYGPLGAQLKRNIVDQWLKFFVDGWDDMYLVDTTIIMNPKVWEASGHVDTFSDPLVECENCHSVFRVDQIDVNKCPSCGKEHSFGQPKPFNLLLRTFVGPTWGSFEPKNGTHLTGKFEEKDRNNQIVLEFEMKELQRNNSVMVYDKQGRTYLRPETAQGIFTNFKNVVDSFQPDMPFGVAQIGKAFRNEISPRDFIFRVREFEIMEFEWFIDPKDWEKNFEKWRKDMNSWFKKLGLDSSKIKEHEVPPEDRAHYSKRTIDFYYDFPSLGFDEIAGLAYRTDFDLKNHQEMSGKNLEYRPKDGGKPFIPHVIEPTFGVDRHVMAVISNSYSVDEQAGEQRIFLKLPAHLAPVKVAVFPLLKNKPELVKKAREVYVMLKKDIGAVEFDDNGNIGKRYRRQDEIGTPYCITIDFDTLRNDTVTVRNRDTTKQERVKITDLVGKLDARQ